MTPDKTNELNRFVKKTIAAALPLFLLVVVYFIEDPFNVVGRYDAKRNQVGEYTFPYNRSYNSVNAFVSNNDSIHYNAFLLGGSRSIYYSTYQWQQYLPTDARPIHMDTSMETLEGILDKIDLIISTGDTIKYALLEFAPFSFNQTQFDDPPFIQDYRLKHSDNYLWFHFKHLISATNGKFLSQYLTARIKGRAQNTDEMKIFEPMMTAYRFDRNECDFNWIDRQIETDSTDYFNSHQEAFSRTDSISYEPPISAKSKALLRQISARLKQQKTDYHIILGPIYNRRISPQSDINLLKSLFGSARVHDYQLLGVESRSNFYDNTHYRYSISSQIMKEIYQPQ